MSGTAEEILALLRAWDAAADPEPLVIETSGSTGVPKRVVLSRAAMRASALATQERLGGPGQWVLNLPPTYVAGVQVLFRSVVAGTDPVLLGDDDLDAARDRMTADRSYLSLVPTQLVRALADPARLATLARFTKVLVGGGPLAPADRAAAETAGVHVVQTYGMSETCGGCVYDGRALPGVEVRIAGGEVQLRGPVLFDGYLDDPERTAATMSDGWLRTHDRGRLDEGRLHIEGRVDDVIITGGVKVPAPAVAQMLAAHPGVQDAHVFGVPDPEWGERVVAVLAGDGATTLEELRAAVTPRSWAPKQVHWVQQIPLLGNGKPDRVAMRRMATDG